MINRKEEIKKKGFTMNIIDSPSNEKVESPFTPVDFSKIKIGAQVLDDAILDLGTYKKADKRFVDRASIMKMMMERDYRKMREISNFYYETSGIYARLCRYMAYMYRYDWMVTPYINEETTKEKDLNNALSEFYKILLYLDNSNLKKLFGDIALTIMRNGCYYGYLIESQSRVTMQQLPVDYCRSRFLVNDKPAVEFNMKYFDDMFKDTEQRQRILKLFPDEFLKAYRLYKEQKLPPLFAGDVSGWYLLDPECAFKFNISGSDAPMFMSVIPAIIDLDEAKAIEKKKMAQ